MNSDLKIFFAIILLTLDKDLDTNKIGMLNTL